MHADKRSDRVLRGTAHNIRFAELVAVVEQFGFRLCRTAGSHRVYRHPCVPVLLVLQSCAGQAKPYQVREFRELARAYNLGRGEDDV